MTDIFMHDRRYMIPTLTQYLLNHLSDHPNHKDLVLIMSDLATIGKYISKETNRAGICNILGATGEINCQNEMAQKLDVLANDMCKRYLMRTNHFAALASEEEPLPVDMGSFGKIAKYVIAFDPIDGSSNIDVNVGIGTIFSVHHTLQDIPQTDEKHFLQRGSYQVLAGYILYGTSTVLVFCFGDAVHEFTLDQSVGEFLLSRENIRFPEKCEYYSVNESHAKHMMEKDRAFINALKNNGCNSRYIGSLVADFHRNLLKGGIFLYPMLDKSGKGMWEAKLRINFEAKPLAFIAHAAGGMAVNDKNDILDMTPESLHQRVPLVIGNKKIVRQYQNMR